MIRLIFGNQLCIVIGDENYYCKFGFVDASIYNIQFNDVEGDTPFFMIKVFYEDSLNFEKAKIMIIHYLKWIKKLDEFDRNFNQKQKK